MPLFDCPEITRFTLAVTNTARFLAKLSEADETPAALITFQVLLSEGEKEDAS